MLTEIHFKNYRAIEDAKLELGPLNLLVGPNGSGKTSVLEAIGFFPDKWPSEPRALRNVGGENPPLELTFRFDVKNGIGSQEFRFPYGRQNEGRALLGDRVDRGDLGVFPEAIRLGKGMRLYAFNSVKMRQPVMITAYRQLATDGANLAGFLDYIRDNSSDAFDALKSTLTRCVPEFDDIGFDGFEQGKKVLKLRLAAAKKHVPASQLSEGTLYLLALLAMVHQPELPTILCLEEPDRGIHPRLYPEIHSALRRLAFPADYGEDRPAVQIIATTHSPYFLDLFQKEPEVVTVCERQPGKGVQFRNLGRDPQARAVLEHSVLGEAWFTGALGGVPAGK